MGEFKGTPGPWKYDDLYTGLVPYIRSKEFIIGSLCLTDGKTPEFKLRTESEANAKLICAAPELLEACLKAKDVFIKLANAGKYPEPLLQENGGEGVQFLTSAINKALGLPINETESITPKSESEANNV